MTSSSWITHAVLMNSARFSVGNKLMTLLHLNHTFRIKLILFFCKLFPSKLLTRISFPDSLSLIFPLPLSISHHGVNYQMQLNITPVWSCLTALLKERLACVCSPGSHFNQRISCLRRRTVRSQTCCRHTHVLQELALDRNNFAFCG